MSAKRYYVWGLNGFLKVLVYERKYRAEANEGNGGYEDCLRIEDPKSQDRAQ